MEAQDGDSVYMVPGVSVPLVLSEKGSNFTLVGECYVEGIMKGEIMIDLDESKKEDIIIE